MFEMEDRVSEHPTDAVRLIEQQAVVEDAAVVVHLRPQPPHDGDHACECQHESFCCRLAEQGTVHYNCEVGNRTPNTIDVVHHPWLTIDNTASNSVFDR